MTTPCSLPPAPCFLFPKLILLAILFIACSGRNNIESQVSENGIVRKISAGNCEDCEYMFAGMPDQINSIDTSDGWSEPGQKLLVSGKVLHLNNMPAPDVLLYYYHTDQKGYYAPGNKKDAGSRKHGRLRGWVKTGPDGDYSIYTNRPAQYPDNKIEAHIHVIVKEPDMNEPYWIDAFIFDDDPLVTTELRNRLDNYGGSGILTTRLEGDVLVTNHDIILGKNIPGYPK